MDSLKSFGEYLKNLRKKRGYTLKQLAEISGVSDAQISRIENGNRGVPKPDNLKKLASALDVPADQFLEKAGIIEKAESAIDDLALIAGAQDPRFYANELEFRNHLHHQLDSLAETESGEFKGFFKQSLWLTAHNFGIHVDFMDFTPISFIDGALSLDNRMRMLLDLELGRIREDWERESIPLNLEDLLKLPNLAFSNQQLTERDRQRVQSMLQLLLNEKGGMGNGDN